MAQSFSCNPRVTRLTGNQLIQVAEEMNSFNLRDDDAQIGLQSPVISRAIDDFQNHSSDFRDKTQQTVDAVGQILVALASGVDDVDVGLFDILLTPTEKAAAQAQAEPSCVAEGK